MQATEHVYISALPVVPPKYQLLGPRLLCIRALPDPFRCCNYFMKLEKVNIFDEASIELKLLSHHIIKEELSFLSRGNRLLLDRVEGKGRNCNPGIWIIELIRQKMLSPYGFVAQKVISCVCLYPSPKEKKVAEI